MFCKESFNYKILVLLCPERTGVYTPLVMCTITTWVLTVYAIIYRPRSRFTEIDSAKTVCLPLTLCMFVHAHTHINRQTFGCKKWYSQVLCSSNITFSQSSCIFCYKAIQCRALYWPGWLIWGCPTCLWVIVSPHSSYWLEVAVLYCPQGMLYLFNKVVNEAENCTLWNLKLHVTCICLQCGGHT